MIILNKFFTKLISLLLTTVEDPVWFQKIFAELSLSAVART
jgi:hypothetical protein